MSQSGIPSFARDMENDAHKRTKKFLLQIVEQRRSDLSTPGSDSHTVQHANHKLFAKALESTILDYTRNIHMPIISRILDLPRELRNDIYMHLWDPTGRRDPRRELLYWWESFREPWFLTRNSSFESPWLTPNEESLRPPHFVDHTFVGKMFAAEVLGQLKAKVGTDLRPNFDTLPVAEFSLADESVYDFVKKDVFEVGITMQELVGNLDLCINLQCDALVDGNDSDDGHATPQHSAFAYNIMQLDHGIDALLQMPYSARNIVHDGSRKRVHSRPRAVALTIRQEDKFDEDGLVSILRLAVRAYHGLKANGSTVRLQYRSEEIGFNVSFAEDAWTWTHNEWEANMREKNVSKVEPQDEHRQQQSKVWRDIKTHFFKV